MTEIDMLLESNRNWAERIKRTEPDFFTNLARQQQPKYLWIGCADSRVPATQITDVMPGDVFVHRNIANVVAHSDLNCLSVLQFAVEVLKVEHVIVVGHYGCGGVKASLSDDDHGLIDNWLHHIRDVRRFHKELVDGVQDEERRVNLLCELNVIEQVRNVCATTIVRNAWASGRDLKVHGWVYSIQDGILHRLSTCDATCAGLDLDPASLPSLSAASF